MTGEASARSAARGAAHHHLLLVEIVGVAHVTRAIASRTASCAMTSIARHLVDTVLPLIFAIGSWSNRAAARIAARTGRRTAPTAIGVSEYLVILLLAHGMVIVSLAIGTSD